LKKERELTEVRSLALKYAELPALQDRRQEIEDEGRRKRAEFDEFSAIAGAVASIDIEIKGLDQLLQQLNDPKGRHRTLNEIASKEEELKEKLSASQAGYKVIEREIQDKNEKLSQFSELDKLWAENSQIRERTLKGHNEYLSAQSEASHVEERREQFTSLSSETKQLRSELDLALVSLRSATDSYSAQEHEAHKDLVIKARDRAVSLDTQRTMLRDREAELENQIVELDSLRSALHEGHRKKDELEQVNQTVEFIRDILKQAGPLVTESYLYNISVEANHLFREISGNVGRTLKWSRDYEIRLEEEGYERPFANLSGGEQMTAALSIRLALLKQLSDIRLAIFDEPTVNMDAERRERLAESIGKVKDFDQLFVISHDDSFEEYVDQVVFVTRDQ
jgi:DNA repair protein SbcC/Rad50